MSIRALEVLSVLGLLDSNHRPIDFSNRSPSDLRELVEYYRTARIRDMDTETQEVRAKDGEFASLVSTVSAKKDLASILPSTLVFGKVFLNDPLFQVARSPNEYAVAENRMLGLKQAAEVRHEVLAKALSIYVDLAPLILCGAVVLLPLEPPRPEGQLPFRYSKDWFRSEIPEHLHDFIHEKAIVNKIEPAGDALVIPAKPVKSPCRGIYVTFTGEETIYSGGMYFLTDTGFEQTKNGTAVVFGGVKWDQPPDKALFDAWVYQSINQTIINRMEDVSRNLRAAECLGACYTTDSGFESRICGHSADTAPSASNRHRAVNLLKANSDFLLTSDARHIAKLRTENPKMFERWQTTLLAASNELTGVDEDFTDKAKQLFEKEIRPQAEDLKKSYQKILGEVGGGVSLAAGALVMSLMTSTVPVAALLAVGSLNAASKAVPAISDYLARRKGPAFIWNQLLSDK